MVCIVTELVRLLLEKGADVQRLTSTLDTPLHGSVAGNKPEITDMLIKAGQSLPVCYVCIVGSLSRRDSTRQSTVESRRLCVLGISASDVTGPGQIFMWRPIQDGAAANLSSEYEAKCDAGVHDCASSPWQPTGRHFESPADVE